MVLPFPTININKEKVNEGKKRIKKRENVIKFS